MCNQNACSVKIKSRCLAIRKMMRMTLIASGLCMLVGGISHTAENYSLDSTTDQQSAELAFFDWGNPQFADGDYFRPENWPPWFSAAYKLGGDWAHDPTTESSAWYVTADWPRDTGLLDIVLDRTTLTNNLVYALHLWDQPHASLYLDLLDNDGLIVAENMFENLLTGDNTPDVIMLDLPLVLIPEACVIRLRRGYGNVTVFAGLLYVDDGTDFDPTMYFYPDYNPQRDDDPHGNDVPASYDHETDIDDSSPESDMPELPDDPRDTPDMPEDYIIDGGRVVYVDKLNGNDSYTGRAPVLCHRSKSVTPQTPVGPKKTVCAGLAAMENTDTLVIKSGIYNESLNISGKNIKVRIEGNVRL